MAERYNRHYVGQKRNKMTGFIIYCIMCYCVHWLEVNYVDIWLIMKEN